MRYRVQFTPDENRTLLVTCPDIPEVATFGEDEFDARVRAADAIVTALQGRIGARQDIPSRPRTPAVNGSRSGPWWRPSWPSTEPCVLMA